MKMQMFVLICFVLVNYIEFASSLICYDCFSTSIGYCGVDFRPSKASKAICLQTETVCYVEKDVIQGINILSRHCGLPTHCSNKTNCTTCTTNLCNSSNAGLRSCVITTTMYLNVLIGLYYYALT